MKEKAPAPTRQAGERRKSSWIAYLSAVLLVVATCGSNSDTHSLQGEHSGPPEPPVEIQLPENPIVAGTSVGYLPGSPEVSPTGEMTYHIPLDVPSGVAGMEPALALHYSSHTGSGPVGRGWSLAGGSSSVTRCPKTLAVEGKRDGVDFDLDDSYCLDGQQLVNVGDNKFRTENDSIAEIEMNGPPASPTGFSVALKSGRFRTYQALAPAQRVSATAQALTLVAGVVLDWPLQDERDRSGNIIHYIYKHSSNPAPPYDEELLLDRIDYTDGPGGSSARRSVEFEYEVRPDLSFAYHHGIRYQLRTRLSRVKMKAPNPTATSLVWEYKLGYHDGILDRSLLDSVQKCGYLGTCTFVKHFVWDQSGSGVYYQPVSLPLSGQRAPDAMLTFDANGDGRDDVLYEVHTDDNPSKVRFHLYVSQSGPGLAPYQDFVVGGSAMGTFIDDMTIAGSRPVDLDGDGRVELLVRKLAPLDYSGDGPPVPVDPDDTRDTYVPVEFIDFNHTFSLYSTSFKADRIDLIDADGDSLLDVVSFKQPDTYKVSLSSGHGTFQYHGQTTSPATTCPYLPIGGDFDADGRGELLVPAASDCNTSATVGFDDTGAVVTRPGVPFRRGERTLQLADLNGDGLVDALWLGDVLEISFNTGNGFGPPQLISDPGLDSVFAMTQDWNHRSAIVTDIDQDGRDDLLFTVHVQYNYDDAPSIIVDHVVALISRGDGSFAREDIFEVEPGTGLRTGDFDGDGRQDLLAAMPDGHLAMYLQQGDGGELLSAVFDGEVHTPARLVVGYGRTKPADWANSTCTFPTLCLRRGAPVVAWVAGLDVGAQTFYHFEDPRVDLAGRGFLGYATVRVWNPARPMERTTTFDNTTRVGTVYPNAQRPKTVRTVVPIVDHGPEGVLEENDSERAHISEVTFDYELRKPQGGPSHFIFTQATHERDWEEKVEIDWTIGARIHITGINGPGPQGAPRQHDTVARVDDYNNLLFLSEATAGGVTHTVISTYYIRPAFWLVGLLATKTEASYDIGEVPDWLHVLNHYDVFGRLETSTIEPSGDPDLTMARTLAYDGRGRLIQETRTAGGQPPRARHFAYGDPSGEGVFLSQQWDEVDSAVVLSKWMYAVPGFGGTMGIIDANGGVATTIHDDLGRPILVTGAGAQPTSIAYSAWTQGGLTAGVEVQVDDATGGSMVVDTDARGLEVQRRRVGWGGQVSVTEAGYDRFGRSLWQSRPGWGTTSSSRAERTYDSLDRVRTLQAPDGALSTQTYTFFERTATDPQMRVRTIVQDADRRVVEAIDMHDGLPLSTTYSYVHGSQPEWVIDPENNMVHSVFDARGRRTLLEDPDAGTRSTRYDGFGDVVETGDGTGDTTSYTLDRVGRVTEITSVVDGTTSLTWDTRPHGLGQLARTISPDHTIVDSYYDEIGRPAKTDWTVPGPTVSMFSVEQTYDSYGRPDELRYPYTLNRPRMVVQPVYGDISGGVSSIRAMGADGQMFVAWNVLDRNADNGLVDGGYGDSMATHRTYDPVSGRLQGISTKVGADTIVGFEYDYYSDGRLAERRDHVASRSEQFTYDDLRRLSSWVTYKHDGATAASYGYDDLGNLTHVDDLDGLQIEANLYTGSGPHQLDRRDGVDFHYDDRGRLDSSTAGLSIEYTDFDLPKSYSKGNGTTEFSYDAGHHRVRKSGPSGTTTYIGGIYERREDATGTKHVFNISGPDGIVAQVVYDQAYPAEDSVEYLHQDPLGSVALATKASGAEIERLFYEPFGKRIDVEGQPLPAPMSDVLNGFTGQRHDDDLGLIDMRGRTYDPILRRFLQPDPVIQNAYQGQNYNRYSYVTNDPVNLVDPTGYVEVEWSDGAKGSIESDGSGATFTEAEIVVNETPESPAEHLGTDSNGEGAAVQGAAALADTWYQSSSTDQGLSTGGGRGSGSKPGTGPTGLCNGCEERDWSSTYLVYSPYAVKGLLYMSGALIGAAAVVAALPSVVVGGLASGGTGLIGGGVAVSGSAASAATSAAAAAGTPTGQAIVEEVEESAVAGGKLGEGLLSHFTNGSGVTGITGVNPSSLQSGQSVSVNSLQFGQGTNSFLAGSPGDIFVTELGKAASSGQLNGIGVFGDKQDFVIQFSRESAFANGVSVDPVSAARSIYSIAGGSSLISSPGGEGAFEYLIHAR